ncbi:MAG TPA: glycosyl hydrolase 53 family protein, partial [Phototrophicaceae bacterium]|nr:glycosyl hydrolase 53 family protein [Phototrophicaceae bacterium]
EVVAQVPNERGLGVFYWEPDWIAVDGAGWKTGEGNAWENQAMFSFNGEALPSLNVFNLVKSGSVALPATLSETYPSEIEVSLGEMPSLPATVKGAYSDDSIREVPVTWAELDPAAFAQGGEVTVYGTVNGTELKASASITVSSYKNYAQNPGFETGDFAPWTVEGAVTAVDISKEASNVHTGDYALHYWLGEPFSFTLSQTVTNLPDGTYTLSAWTHGGGGEKILQLFVSDYGGEPLTAEIVNTEWLVWSTPTISAFTVTGGQCTIGLRVTSPGGSWAFLDDVALVKID